jgi:hypothetical protein
MTCMELNAVPLGRRQATAINERHISSARAGPLVTVPCKHHQERKRI